MFKAINKCITMIFLCVVFSTFSISAFADVPAAGVVLVSKGLVQVVNAQNQKRSLSRGSRIYAGEKITTGANSDVQIRFSDDGIVSLRANTEYQVNSYEFKGTQDKNANIASTLVKGKMRALTGAITKENPKGYTLKTKLATIGITGTEFATEITDKLQTLEVYHGTVDFSSRAGSIAIGDNSPYNAAMVTEASGAPVGFTEAPSFFTDPEEASDEEIASDVFSVDNMLEDAFYDSYEPGLDEDLAEEDLGDLEEDADLEEEDFDFLDDF